MCKEIKIGFYSGENVDRTAIERLKGCDAALFTIKSLYNVKIKDELDGKCDLLLKMSSVSKKIGGISFFSVFTDTYWVMRNSIAFFSDGKLISIADQNGVFDRSFSPSFGLKSVEKGGVKFGVLVGSDVLDVSALKSLALTENDVIINLSAAVFEFDNEKLISCLSFLCGVPIAFSGKNKKVISKSNGEIVYSGESDFFVCRLQLKKVYKEKFEKVLRS